MYTAGWRPGRDATNWRLIFASSGATARAETAAAAPVAIATTPDTHIFGADGKERRRDTDIFFKGVWVLLYGAAYSAICSFSGFRGLTKGHVTHISGKKSSLNGSGVCLSMFTYGILGRSARLSTWVMCRGSPVFISGFGSLGLPRSSFSPPSSSSPFPMGRRQTDRQTDAWI